MLHITLPKAEVAKKSAIKIED
ncbi:hypothetical protein [Weissella confusa]|nr:hypothetical protein [Weissella confusa]